MISQETSQVFEEKDGGLKVKESKTSVIYRDRKGSMMVNQTNLLFGVKKGGSEAIKLRAMMGENMNRSAQAKNTESDLSCKTGKFENKIVKEV